VRFGDFAFVTPPELPPLIFGGLAVTTDHYLVAGIVDPGGLAIFDLLAGGGPARWLWATGIEFRPVDLAARPSGGIVVLDRGSGHARYWLLDRRLIVEPVHAATADAPQADFSPVEGALPGAGSAPVATLVGDDSAPLAGDPISIEAAADGSVIVLDGAARSIRRYLHGAAAGAAVPLRHGVHDMALVPDSTGDPTRLGSLYVMGDSGTRCAASPGGVWSQRATRRTTTTATRGSRSSSSEGGST
jgi:hypothetical protein